MLVIAVIVAVTIGITKHKLDNIVTYTYYSAYSSLRTATSQMLVDYDPKDDRYKAKLEEPTLLAKVQSFLAYNFGILAVNAIEFGSLQTGVNTGVQSDWGASRCGGANSPSSCQDNGCYWCMQEHKCAPDRNSCASCPSGKRECYQLDPGAELISISGKYIYCCPVKSGSGGSSGSGINPIPACKVVLGFNQAECENNGGVWCPSRGGLGLYTCTNDSRCCGSIGGDGGSSTCQPDGSAPCGKEWDYNTCSWKNKSGFSRSCSANQTWSEEDCKCITKPVNCCPQGGTNVAPKTSGGGLGLQEFERCWRYSATPGAGCLAECEVCSNNNCVGSQPPCSTCVNGVWTKLNCLSGKHLDESTCTCVDDEEPTPDCTGGKVWNGSACVCPDGKEEYNGSCVDPCTGGKVRDGSGNCVCPAGTIEQGGSCVDDPSDDCTGGQVWNGSSCECPSGTIWDGSSCKADMDCSGTQPCGTECDRTTGTWVDIAGFSRECNEEQNKVWSETQCSCIPSARTITLNGQKYCEYLVSLFNTKTNGNIPECSGNAIGANETSFSGKTPDIILRNGMLLYNVRQNPQALAVLANNTSGSTAVLNGVDVDTNRWGYTVYIDIDGAKSGSSTLWEDVYPFYVTLGGMVIPGYDKDHPGQYGGDSRNHMQVSLEDEVIENGRRKIKWLAKSVSYKEAACAAGYVGANTPYCREGNAAVYNNECSVDNSLCRLKYIKPVKFLF